MSTTFVSYCFPYDLEPPSESDEDENEDWDWWEEEDQEEEDRDQDHSDQISSQERNDEARSGENFDHSKEEMKEEGYGYENKRDWEFSKIVKGKREKVNEMN